MDTPPPVQCQTYIIFLASEYYRPLASTKLYYFVAHSRVHKLYSTEQ